MGQRLSVATHLTSFPTTNNNNNTSSFFSFEIHHDKLALYFNSGINNSKYSYWQFQASNNTNITFIDLSSTGLDLFDDMFVNFSQIRSPISNPVRFLGLDNDTGNLGLYYYSPYKDKFEASFQVINTTCDLPLACSPYGICTFSGSCSCVRSKGGNHNPSCDEGITGGFCVKGDQVEVLELQDVGSVLKNATYLSNISKKQCADYCVNECECAAALYSEEIGECMVYDVVRGVKQVHRGSGLSYLVKVPKGTNGKHKKSGLRKWVLVLILVVDGLLLFVVLGGFGYFMIGRRRKRSSDSNSNSNSNSSS